MTSLLKKQAIVFRNSFLIDYKYECEFGIKKYTNNEYVCFLIQNSRNYMVLCGYS